MVELEAKGQASAQSTTGTLTLGANKKKKKIMVNGWFSILVILGNLAVFGNFGQFRHFKVNLGSGNNFAFLTLNFSDQNF